MPGERRFLTAYGGGRIVRTTSLPLHQPARNRRQHVSKLTRKFNSLSAIVLALTLLAASLVLFPPGRAKASSSDYYCPPGYQCLYTTTYYSDYTRSQVVGTCNGTSCGDWEYCSGVKTEYWTSSWYYLFTLCN
jgi:hypothetical protein